MNFFRKLVKPEIKQSLIIAGFTIFYICCNYKNEKEEKFILRPAVHKIYNYSLTKTSKRYTDTAADYTSAARHVSKRVVYDTVKLDFGLEGMPSTDSLTNFTLTFNDLTWIKPAVIVTTQNGKVSVQPNLSGAFDSVTYTLSGRLLKISVTNRGQVEAVYGMKELFEYITKTQNENIENRIADHVSINAVKDLFNKIFSVVAGSKINNDDKWVRNVTLKSKAPVKISNLYIMDRHVGDTAEVNIQSILSAEQSEGGRVYMKGKQNGKAIVSYSTGMPHLYETWSETVTTTDYDNLICQEHFIVKRR